MIVLTWWNARIERQQTLICEDDHSDFILDAIRLHPDAKHVSVVDLNGLDRLGESADQVVFHLNKRPSGNEAPVKWMWDGNEVTREEYLTLSGAAHVDRGEREFFNIVTSPKISESGLVSASVNGPFVNYKDIRPKGIAPINVGATQKDEGVLVHLDVQFGDLSGGPFETNVEISVICAGCGRPSHERLCSKCFFNQAMGDK